MFYEDREDFSSSDQAVGRPRQSNRNTFLLSSVSFLSPEMERLFTT